MCHCEDAHVETALLQHHGAWSSGSGTGSYLFVRVPWQCTSSCRHPAHSDRRLGLAHSQAAACVLPRGVACSCVRMSVMERHV